jgi:hypothetical protein
VKYYDYEVKKAFRRNGKPRDKVPPIEQIRSLYEVLEVRSKFTLTLLVFSAVRVGAFNHFTLKDLEELESE